MLWLFVYLLLFFFNYLVVTFWRARNYFFLRAHQVLITGMAYMSFQPNTAQFYKIDSFNPFYSWQSQGWGVLNFFLQSHTWNVANLGFKPSFPWLWELGPSHDTVLSLNDSPYLSSCIKTLTRCLIQDRYELSDGWINENTVPQLKEFICNLAAESIHKGAKE